MSQDMSAEYIDYDLEKGIWSFKVEHFSVYGFKEDEDDYEDDEDEPNFSDQGGDSYSSKIQDPYLDVLNSLKI